MIGSLDEDHPDYPHLSMMYVLSNCEDFQKEASALESLIRSYGHICLFAPKRHPETAECGIEYDNGVAKKHFRKQNLQIGQNCDADVRKAYLSISLSTAKKTARRARMYVAAYMDNSGGSFHLIEKFVQVKKCHCNIVDQEVAYLKTLENEQIRVVVKLEQE